MLRLDNTAVVATQSFEHIPKENEEKELEEITKEFILHIFKVYPFRCELMQWLRPCLKMPYKAKNS